MSTNNEQIVNKKEGQPMPWLDEEDMFYMLTSDGLMICRNHYYFTSCVPARSGPSDLAEQKPFCRVAYPRVPADLVAQVAGFFQWADDEWYGEAAVILLHNPELDQMKIMVPVQECSAGSVHYTVPNNIEPGWRMIGDIHSHVRFAAFASGTDTHDEVGRPGVHIVIGKINQEPPDFHAEVVVDRMRFKVDLDEVMEDYQGRTGFPEEWKKQVSKKKWEWKGWEGAKHYWKGGHHHDQLAD